MSGKNQLQAAAVEQALFSTKVHDYMKTLSSELPPGVRVEPAGQIIGSRGKHSFVARYRVEVWLNPSLAYWFTRHRADLLEGANTFGLADGHHEVWLDGVAYEGKDESKDAPPLVRHLAEIAFAALRRIVAAKP